MASTPLLLQGLRAAEDLGDLLVITACLARLYSRVSRVTMSDALSVASFHR